MCVIDTQIGDSLLNPVFEDIARHRLAPGINIGLDLTPRCNHQPALVPLRAGACLPSCRAHVTKLGPATARHVKVVVRKLDELMALRAVLPALCPSEVEDALGLDVGRARLVRRVRSRIARTASVCKAFVPWQPGRVCGGSGDERTARS
jgi:hypothetical protein